MKIDIEITRNIQRIANSFARQHGYGIATEVIVDNEVKAPYILERVEYGWRKNTTGEYVSNAYRNNFGWKNTFYQNAKTIVVIPYDYV